MNLTYLAVTVGIVLATMVVYALLYWLHGPRDLPPVQPPPASQPVERPQPAAALNAPASTSRRKKRRKGAPALAADTNTRQDPS